MQIYAYYMQMDWNRNELYDHPLTDITSYVKLITYNYGATQPFQAVAPTSRMVVEVNNTLGDFNPEKSGGTFAGMWKWGMMARLGMTYIDNANNYQFKWLMSGALVSIQPQIDEYGNAPSAILTFEDAGSRLVDSEVSIPFMQFVDTGSALVIWGWEGGLIFPYSTAHAMLDVPGTAELDSTASLLYARALTSVQGGNTILRWVGDAHDRGLGVSGASFIDDIVKAEMGGRWWYHAPYFGYSFRNRNNYVNTPPAQITLQNEILSQPPPEYRFLENVINRVDINFTPREIAAGGIVFSNPRAIRLTPLQTQTITARYTDPLNPDTRIAALGVIQPTPYGDFFANLAEDGSAADRTWALVIGIETSGQKATLHLQNVSGDTIYVTKLQLRASTLLKTYSPQTVTKLDPFSIAEHGERKVTYDIRMLDSAELAEQFAQQILLRFAFPHGFYARLSVMLSEPNNVLPYTVDNIIAVNHAFSQSTGGVKHRIAGESAVIDAMAMTHLQTWVLEPVDITAYGVLDDSARGRLDQTARLGF